MATVQSELPINHPHAPILPLLRYPHKADADCQLGFLWRKGAWTASKPYHAMEVERRLRKNATEEDSRFGVLRGYKQDKKAYLNQLTLILPKYRA